MAALPRYDKTGAQAGELEVPTAFAGAPHAVTLHQAVLAELAGQRQGTHSTKTRGEVAGSGRKLWRQKGTGRARVGDRRPPNRVGGGTVTGPRPRSHDQRLSGRMKQEALRSAVAARVEAGEVMALEAVELPEAKTKALQGLLDALGVSGDVLLVLPEHDALVWRCGRNIEGLRIAVAADINAYDVMAARKVILVQDALSRLEARVA
jgi:large subunit ribosomal protein L4